MSLAGGVASWLTITRGDAPLIVSIPHTGTVIPEPFEERLVSGWLARKDTDWHVERLYDFAPGLGATVVRTGISRTVIDVNRDPSGISLYPGQATTGLCPVTTFDGEPLWKDGRDPDGAEVASRRAAYFEPYHAALAGEITRLRAVHPAVAVYDCHSIRSAVPRLFDGVLPNLNIGTNDGQSAAASLGAAVEDACDTVEFTRVVNGRFKGGYITRHYGRPADGVHAVQMELACRGYMCEPAGEVDEKTWPVPYDEQRAGSLRAVLQRVLDACLTTLPHL